jgi:hypothetical protein|tara:strand:- start:629 stop:907 length:279 start_codon:yes stop_codon:yes gene_type:complete
MQLNKLPKVLYKNQIKYPNDIDPIVNKLVYLINSSKLKSKEVCQKANVNTNAIAVWRDNYGKGKRNPSLWKIQAVLKVLGYKLVIRSISAKD